MGERLRQTVAAYEGWVKRILLAVCGDREGVAEEIFAWNENGETDIYQEMMKAESE